MCLYQRDANNTRFRKALGNATWFWAWKRLVPSRTRLHSPTKWRTVWQPGWNRSSRKSATVTERGPIEHGIHAYTTRRSAARAQWGSDVIVRVKVYVKDLAAVGWFSELVATKVFLPKSEYDKALKG